MNNTVYEFNVKSIKNEMVSLSKYKGKVLIVVNVASECGFTPQYDGLEKLYEKYHDKGLEILAFPCNQFGRQEPGTHEEIQSFCTSHYGVKFPVFAKVNVNGGDADPFFAFVKKQAPGILGTKGIKWNFTKFLVGKDGKTIKRYAPKDKPESMIEDIEAALK